MFKGKPLLQNSLQIQNVPTQQILPF